MHPSATVTFSRVADAVSSTVPQPDFDLLREVHVGGGPHRFLSARKADPSDGCRVPPYTAAEMMAMWKEVYSDYKLRMGRFDVSGAHDTSLDNVASYCKSSTATATFYLYQTCLAVPGMLEFAGGGFLKEHEFDTSAPPPRLPQASAGGQREGNQAKKGTVETLLTTVKNDSSAIHVFLAAATTREQLK
eukprot:GHVU01112218.1.p1 GENE.GHVU01112218.1~~GHVU01112218.1.p1  ORF type:complete len:189 (+),score=27.83 GHVU01112218.1:112-678(+)